jgi:hypothetical protein
VTVNVPNTCESDGGGESGPKGKLPAMPLKPVCTGLGVAALFPTFLPKSTDNKGAAMVLADIVQIMNPTASATKLQIVLISLSPIM